MESRSDSSAPVVLVVDDESHIRESCRQILEDRGFPVITASRCAEALELIRSRRPGIVLADMRLPDGDGMTLLRAAREVDPEAAFIVITGFATVDASTEAFRQGVYDYLAKPFSALQLQILVGRASRQVALARENRQLRERVRSEYTVERMVGSSSAMQEVFTLIQRIAPTDASVFISGESGTGKELVARAVHARSRRAGRPFVAVNCAALPPHLLESELFGHERGAFTGAVSRKEGLLEHASGGTFFLDELCEMPLELQAKLLRVIQDRRIRRVGGHQEVMVDLRFLAATNREPARAVEEGVLRKDLFFRLNVVPVRLPPLRARVTDIPVLLSHFLKNFTSQYHGEGVVPLRLGPAAAAALRAYPWPGNVRELQNLAERLVSLCEPGREVQWEDLPVEIREPEEARPTGLALAPRGANMTFHEAKTLAVEAFERSYLRELMIRHKGNISSAAREAEVDRRTVHRMLKRHGLWVPQARAGGSGSDAG
jgi:DNA-binding NtrC family response regulator